MTEEQLEVLHYEIKYRFYYIEYPTNVAPNWWKDGAGKLTHLSDMGLDHLKACIKMIERDTAQLRNSGRDDEVTDAILPLALQKLFELKKVFQKKVEF